MPVLALPKLSNEINSKPIYVPFPFLFISYSSSRRQVYRPKTGIGSTVQWTLDFIRLDLIGLDLTWTWISLDITSNIIGQTLDLNIGPSNIQWTHSATARVGRSWILVCSCDWAGARENQWWQRDLPLLLPDRTERHSIRQRDSGLLRKAATRCAIGVALWRTSPAWATLWWCGWTAWGSWSRAAAKAPHRSMACSSGVCCAESGADVCSVRNLSSDMIAFWYFVGGSLKGLLVWVVAGWLCRESCCVEKATSLSLTVWQFGCCLAVC
jgi:hypothetical protein